MPLKPPAATALPRGDRTALPVREFVALMAVLISITALAIDTMLPALPLIARDLGAGDASDAQHVVTFMFAGFCFGQLVYGPLSDSIGRKPTIYSGVAVFVLGCATSLLSADFTTMLVGRVLQGVGAASLRVVTMALVRDQYAGAPMARIVALIMAVFVVIPAVAPALGQLLIAWFAWRAIFVLLLIQSLLALLWFAARQPETLAAHARRPLSLRAVAAGALEVCGNRVAAGYTLASGCVFGALIGYLTSAQPIFQGLYGVGDGFAAYFGALALAIGLASVTNSRLVNRLGMQRLTGSALAAVCALSVGYGVLVFARPGTPPLWTFMAFMLPVFFAVGIMFGNFNALAMEPLGHLAGIGAAIVGCGSTLVALTLGAVIGQSYDGTVRPLVLGFAVCGAMSLVAMRWVELTRDSAPATTTRP